MENDALVIMSDLLTVGLLMIFYDPSDTFLRHTCEKKHDDKASPHGECSPFIE